MWAVPELRQSSLVDSMGDFPRKFLLDDSALRLMESNVVYFSSAVRVLMITVRLP